MAIFPNWKPKTVAGKLIKGAVLGGGSILGLVTGLGAIGGVVKGVGVGAGIKAAAGTTKTVIDKVGASAVNLITGTTAEQRQILSEYKQELKTEAQKLEFANKLVELGMSQEEARAKAGISAAETVKGESDIKPATVLSSIGNNKVLMWGLIGVGVLFLLSKLNKR